jgi:tetratricopeptide (TPR) repeat protein
MHRRLHGEQHPETGWALRTLGSALVPQQKFAEAETALREGLAIFRYQFPADHTNIRDTIYQLRTLLEARGDKPALEALVNEEAGYAMRSDRPDFHVRLAGLLLTNNPTDAQKQEARRLVRHAIEEYGQVAVDSHDNLDRRLIAAAGFVELIKICVAAPGFSGEVDEVNRRLTAGLPKLLAAFPDSSICQWQTAETYSDWANGLLPYSNYLPTAEDAYRKSIEIVEKLSQSDPKRPGIWLYLANTYAWLGNVQQRLAKLEEADAAYRRAMEIYDQHAAEIAKDATPYIAINDYLQFALYLAATHREEEAAELVRKAAVDAKRLTDPVELENGLFFLALAQLRLCDEAGYRGSCRALANVPDRGGDSARGWPAFLIWCLGPDALDDPSLLVKRAEEFAAHNSLNPRHFELMVLGAALYRGGRYEQAAERLNESIAAYPSAPPTGFDTLNVQRLLLAMTTWHQGQQVEARRLLAKWLPDVDKELQTPSILGTRRATLEVLCREAETLIGQNEAEEAVENVSRTSDESKQ